MRKSLMYSGNLQNGNWGKPTTVGRIHNQPFRLMPSALGSPRGPYNPYWRTTRLIAGWKRWCCRKTICLPSHSFMQMNVDMWDMWKFKVIYCIKVFLCMCIYIHIYMWRGPLCIEWRGLEKIPHNTYNNCPKANFDFICRFSTLSNVHLSSEDLRTSITIP